MQAGNYCGKTVVEADLDAARFSGASEAELFEMEESAVSYTHLDVYKRQI